MRPRFVHHLVDQSGALPAQVQGGLKAQIAQLLMMAAYHEPVPELLAVGVAWEMITAATGIDPDQFQALKQQLQQLAAAQADDEDDKMTR